MEQAFLPLARKQDPGVALTSFTALKEMDIKFIGDILKKSQEEMEERLWQ